MMFTALYMSMLITFSPQVFGDPQRVGGEERSNEDRMADQNRVMIEPLSRSSDLLHPGVGKEIVSYPGQKQCEGLSSNEYCVCRGCIPEMEEICAHACHQNLTTEFRFSPLSEYHSLVGRVLNQTECWVCSQVPQKRSSVGLIPYPLSLEEIHNLSKGRPLNKRYLYNRSPVLRLHPYQVDKSLICWNFTSSKALGTWEVTWYNQTITYSQRPDGEPLNLETLHKIRTSGRHFKYTYTVKQKKVMAGRVPTGYCAKVLQPDTCTSQIGKEGMGMFMWILCEKVMKFSVPYFLPDDVYFICGRRAYKWLSMNHIGLCYLGRVLPEVTTLTHDTMRDIHTGIPSPYTHTHYTQRYRRDLKTRSEPLATDLVHETFGYQILVALDITRTARGVINFKYIQALANLIDNITEIYDDTFRYTGKELQAYKRELVQHRMVLNYLTAMTGGYCLTLSTQFGVKCCTYLTNNTDDPDEVIDHKMDEILQLKWEFRKRHNASLGEVGESITGWVSWLNPMHWFSGLGEWAQGVIASIGKLLLCIGGVILLFGLLFKCIRWATRDRVKPTEIMSMRTGVISEELGLEYDPQIETSMI